MTDNIRIQVGDKHYAIQPDHLPPVGTRLMVHKHLYDGGTSPMLEVIAHEWRLDEPPEEKALPVFSIIIKTQVVP